MAVDPKGRLIVPIEFEPNDKAGKPPMSAAEAAHQARSANWSSSTHTPRTIRDCGVSTSPPVARTQGSGRARSFTKGWSTSQPTPANCWPSAPPTVRWSARIGRSQDVVVACDRRRSTHPGHIRIWNPRLLTGRSQTPRATVDPRTA